MKQGWRSNVFYYFQSFRGGGGRTENEKPNTIPVRASEIF